MKGLYDTEKYHISDTQIEAAAQCNCLSLDGTFSTCPSPFFQNFILIGELDGKTYELAWVLMPNKLQATYKDVLLKFVEICQSAGKQLDFNFVITDGERGLINAAREVFDTAKLLICHFHVSDSQRRFVTDNGLKPLIRIHEDIKKFYYRSKKIFFLPAEVWPTTWRLMKEDLDSTIEPSHTDFLYLTLSKIHYFEKLMGQLRDHNHFETG